MCSALKVIKEAGHVVLAERKTGGRTVSVTLALSPYRPSRAAHDGSFSIAFASRRHFRLMAASAW